MYLVIITGKTEWSPSSNRIAVIEDHKHKLSADGLTDACLLSLTDVTKEIKQGGQSFSFFSFENYWGLRYFCDKPFGGWTYVLLCSLIFTGGQFKITIVNKANILTSSLICNFVCCINDTSVCLTTLWLKVINTLLFLTCSQQYFSVKTQAIWI